MFFICYPNKIGVKNIAKWQKKAYSIQFIWNGSNVKHKVFLYIFLVVRFEWTFQDVWNVTLRFFFHQSIIFVHYRRNNLFLSLLRFNSLDNLLEPECFLLKHLFFCFQFNLKYFYFCPPNTNLKDNINVALSLLIQAPCRMNLCLFIHVNKVLLKLCLFLYFIFKYAKISTYLSISLSKWKSN